MYFDAETTTQVVWTYPYNYEFAPPERFLTTASIPEYTPGSTQTVTINTSTLKPVSDTYPVSDIKVGDFILDDMGNYGKVTNINGANITVEADAHIAPPVESYDKFDRRSINCHV